MPYEAFKVIHLFGVIVFLGNIIVTGVWKVMADRTGDPRTMPTRSGLSRLPIGYSPPAA
jgi:uncharacterized membrane protein